MIRRVVLGLAMIASMLSAGAAAPARAAEPKQPPDLTGQWRLDPKRSDTPQPPGGGPGMRRPREGGGRGGGPGGGGGGWGGRGGMGGGMGRGPGGPGGDVERGPRGGGAGMRPARLPDLMHVTQTGTVVSFEDSSGAVVQEITTLAGAEDTLVHAPKAQVLSGQWTGETLVVERLGPGGGKLTEIISLEDKGSLLVIRTKMAGSGDMPSREFKRVYKRVSD